MLESENEDLHAGDSEMDDKDAIDIEKGTIDLEKVPQSEAVRFDEVAHSTSLVGIGLPRTLTIERPRYSQSNKVIADFRTLSIQITRGDTINDDKKKKKTLADIADLEWHKLAIGDILTMLCTNSSLGLDEEQAKSRLLKDGLNVFSKPPNRWLVKILTYTFGGFGTLLTGAAMVCFIAWAIGEPPQSSNLALAIILCVVIVASAAFNAWQDFTTSRVMESVRDMLPSDVPVTRQGKLHIIPAAQIARGDLIKIKMGAKVPADCRICSIASELKFDRSSLTGESRAIAATIDKTDDNYLESRNVVMAGTKCVAGEGYAIVTATGDSTIFGRLAKQASAPKVEKTTLEKEIFIFVLTIAIIAFSVAGICIIIWGAYLRPKHPAFMNVSALLVNIASIMVAFIPEGLPINVSLSLTIVAAKMRRAKVLISSLSVVETLGSVNVTCSDKTGTLTQNNMTVCNYAVHGFEEDDLEEYNRQIALDAPIGKAFSHLGWLAAVCNAAKYTNEEKTKIIGDATDSACLKFAQDVVGVDESNESWSTLQLLSFNSTNKFAARLMHTEDAKAVLKSLPEGSAFNSVTQALLTVKGGPDVLFQRCTMTLDASGQDVPLTPQRQAFFTGLQNQWAKQGKRVLLLARRIVNKIDIEDITEEQLADEIRHLTIVGLLGIVDPPRPEIPSVVKTVRRAGSRFFMVTGDFEATAVAIARQCGIITTSDVKTYEDIHQGIKFAKYSFLDDNDSRPQRALRLNGSELEKLQPEEWEQVCNFDEIVFARTTPDQKLKIVEEFQSRNGIVAMVGDGVNDSPALKKAHCGIAMSGPNTSEVAIEAADLVLLESFSSFVDALLLGRLCFDNLKKTIVYLLPAGSFSELWPVLLSFFFGLPQILSNIQMILICVLTDLFPSLSMVYEKPEADVLLRKPRNTKSDRLANWQLLFQAYFIGVILTVTSSAMAFWWMARRGISFSDMWLKYAGGSVQVSQPDYFNQVLYEANAIYFFNLVITQYFNLHTLRTRRLSLFQQWPYWGKGRNLYILPAIATSFFFAILLSYIPAIQSAFLTRGIQVEFFFLPFAWGLFIISIDEMRKLAVRTWANSSLARLAW